MKNPVDELLDMLNRLNGVNQLQLNRAFSTLFECKSTTPSQRIRLNAIAEKNGYVFAQDSKRYVPDERPVVGPMHREPKQIKGENNVC